MCMTFFFLHETSKKVIKELESLDEDLLQYTPGVY